MKLLRDRNSEVASAVAAAAYTGTVVDSADAVAVVAAGTVAVVGMEIDAVAGSAPERQVVAS